MILLALVCAASRFLARAASLWDWDEALFSLGLRAYDVTAHHPHPPGFPAYIALGHVARIFVHDDFRALQTVNLIAAVALFPAMFFLARELRLRFYVSVIAAALTAFLPNVWFFGGTAFSDVPSIVLVVLAVALLLRGCRDRRSYLLGTIVLAVAIGIRPQNFLIGLWPGLVATWWRARDRVADVVLAAVLGTVISVGAFYGAVVATGSWESYYATVKNHADYIARVDSWRSPARPPLWRIFDRFFLKQYQSIPLSVIMTLFVAVSVTGAVRERDRRIGTLAMAFAPFAVTAWMMLDRFSISRFSIGYAPLFTILAADGIARVARQRRDVAIGIATALIAGFIAFTLPALNVVRTGISPSVAGVNAVTTNLDPARDQLYVARAMSQFIDYYEPHYPWIALEDPLSIPLSSTELRPWLLAEVFELRPGMMFRRERGALWNIARRHYFDVSLAPLTRTAVFQSGWYPPERQGRVETRWMAGRSVTLLPPSEGVSRLRVICEIPAELMPQRPTVTIRMNGVRIASIQPDQPRIEEDLEITPAAGGARNTLELEISRTLDTTRAGFGGEHRQLGLLIHQLGWGPK